MALTILPGARGPIITHWEGEEAKAPRDGPSCPPDSWHTPLPTARPPPAQGPRAALCLSFLSTWQHLSATSRLSTMKTQSFRSRRPAGHVTLTTRNQPQFWPLPTRSPCSSALLPGTALVMPVHTCLFPQPGSAPSLPWGLASTGPGCRAPPRLLPGTTMGDGETQTVELTQGHTQGRTRPPHCVEPGPSPWTLPCGSHSIPPMLPPHPVLVTLWPLCP